MLLRDGQVVDVDLAPLALELPQFVGGEPSDDLIAVASHDDDEGRRGEERLQVGVRRNRALIRFDVLERLAEHPQQVLQGGGV